MLLPMLFLWLITANLITNNAKGQGGQDADLAAAHTHTKMKQAPLCSLVRITKGGETEPPQQSQSVLQASPQYSLFNFNAKKFISLKFDTETEIDTDLTDIHALVFESLKEIYTAKTDDLMQIPENFVQRCASLLTFPQPQERADTTHSNISMLEEYVKAGHFHILEFVNLVQYCNSSVKRIRIIIDETEQELIHADGTYLAKVKDKLKKHDEELAELEVYKQHAWSVLKSLYHPKHRAIMATCRAEEARTLIPTPTSNTPHKYTSFLQKVLSTKCAPLAQAFRQESILFVDDAQ